MKPSPLTKDKGFFVDHEWGEVDPFTDEVNSFSLEDVSAAAALFLKKMSEFEHARYRQMKDSQFMAEKYRCQGAMYFLKDVYSEFYECFPYITQTNTSEQENKRDDVQLIDEGAGLEHNGPSLEAEAGNKLPTNVYIEDAAILSVEGIRRVAGLEESGHRTSQDSSLMCEGDRSARDPSQSAPSRNEVELVCARLEAMPDNLNLYFGTCGPLTKHDMIQEICAGTELGCELVDVHMRWIRACAGGTLKKELDKLDRPLDGEQRCPVEVQAGSKEPTETKEKESDTNE